MTAATAVPLDGHDDTWRCTTCQTVFASDAGFAVCPACPAEIDGSVADPDELLRLILADARRLARLGGRAGQLARRVLALDAALSRDGVLPLPWAAPLDRPVTDIPLPRQDLP
jgi:hypothetical protein